MSAEVVVLVVVDTNILVPSIFATTPILKFIIEGNLVPVGNQFIFDEVKRILQHMWDKWYSKKMGQEKLAEAKELLKIVHLRLLKNAVPIKAVVDLAIKIDETIWNSLKIV